MKSDVYSNPIFEYNDIFELIYSGHIDVLPKLILDECPETSNLIKYSEIKCITSGQVDYSLSVNDYDKMNQANWFIPEEYKNLDIKDYCLKLCKTDEERLRVSEELEAFEEKKLLELLKTLKYIVDTLRKEKVLWGVGRGSAVSSYVLFLIGIHKINSIKYNLNWREFLR